MKDVTLKDIYCNTNNVPVPSAVSVKGGDTVTFEWYHDNPGDNDLATSHKGPITVYIAPRSSNGEGHVWTKIAHDGLNPVDKKWATERLYDNGGKHDVKLPPQLSPGEYLQESISSGQKLLPSTRQTQTIMSIPIEAPSSIHRVPKSR